ncbi:MAG: 6-phosphogluconolactonase, partial [Bacteroidota bacterium]|nr:6-phosphogluconolactonase [Bacteroidota bacterium]
KRNYIYPDRDSMTAAFVCEFSRTLEEYAEKGRQIHIALSGGSTPLSIFRQLTGQTTREEWSHVSLYWGDERCVPPDHPESNYGNARETLLDPLGLDKDLIHRIRGEEPPPEEADRYSKELLKFLPSKNGFPVFDWIWLGLGADGHTASIFPQEIELWTSGAPCVVTRHPDSGQTRISLSGGVLNAAKRVTFITSGEEKASVIQEIFMKEGKYMSYPAFYVSPVSDNLEWYMDQNAARLL